MEMNSLVKNEFVGDPTVKIRHQYPRSFFVVLLLINILTIVFGCVIIVKLTGSTTKTELDRDNQKLSLQLISMIEGARHDMKAAINDVEKKIEGIQGRLDQHENLFSQLAKNMSGTDEQESFVMNRIKTMETENGALEKKIVALQLNVTDEMEVIRTGFYQDKNLISQLVKNISGMDEQVLDIIKRTQTTEAANNASEKKVIALLNIPEEMEKMRERFNYHDENLFPQLARNISGIEKQILDIVKHTQVVEAGNSALEKRMTTYLPTPDEMKKMIGRLDQDEYLISQLVKNISGTDKQVLDILNHTQALEEANKASEKKFSDSLEGLSATGKIIWKFDEYESKIGNMKEHMIYYSPTFYSSQFGYKMRLKCAVNQEYIQLGLTLLIGVYDNLLKWPFTGNVTLEILDQSEQPENISEEWKDIGRYCTFAQNDNGMMFCYSQNIATREKLRSRNFIRNDTLYIGFKVQSKDLLKFL